LILFFHSLYRLSLSAISKLTRLTVKDQFPFEHVRLSVPLDRNQESLVQVLPSYIRLHESGELAVRGLLIRHLVLRLSGLILHAIHQLASHGKADDTGGYQPLIVTKKVTAIPRRA
jgi:hypothetical protein